jgi:hypothetical protein
MATQSFRQSDGSFKPVLGSPAPFTALANSSDQEAHRRSRLAASDELLDEIEELNLLDHRALPSQLRNRITALHFAITGARTESKIKTCVAAHDFVFALQEPLMAGNPRTSAARPSSHSRPGQPITVRMPVAGAWKLLSLPAEPDGGLTEDWFVLATLTIERAWERWAYAQHHAVAAARRRSRSARQAAARAIVAWSNYWQLLEEADRLRGLPQPPAEAG